MLLIQSFCPKRTDFADFQAFIAALGDTLEHPGQMTAPIELGRRPHLGWVGDKPR